MIKAKLFHLPLYEMLWYFIIYSCLGWIMEMIVVGIELGRITNRGVLNIPICPIYGFGILLILLILGPFNKNIVRLFIVCVVITTVVEYITGVALQSLFHRRWWNYSGHPYNLDGHVSLLISLAWGIVCVFILKVIHPKIRNIVCRINPEKGRKILAVLYFTVVADVIITFSILIGDKLVR